MQPMIRLYRQHDLDLIGLCKTDRSLFRRELKNALLAYVTGQPYQIIWPADIMPEGYVSKVTSMHIVLKESDPAEKAAIDMLSTLKKGMRNSFLKALFRSYLSSIPLSSYTAGDSLILTKEEAVADIVKNIDEKERNTTKIQDVSTDTTTVRTDRPNTFKRVQVPEPVLSKQIEEPSIEKTVASSKQDYEDNDNYEDYDNYENNNNSENEVVDDLEMENYFREMSLLAH